MNEIYKFKYDLTDDQWYYMQHAVGIEKVIDNAPLMEAIIHFAEDAVTMNPYYKFFEVLSWVRDAKRVHFVDLETLEQYYPTMHTIDYLLTPSGRYFTGVVAHDREELSKLIGYENNRFDYDYLCQLIIALHIAEFAE